MKRQRNMLQMKKQDKTTARDPSEMYINNMPDQEFKVMIIKILTGLEKRVEDLSETFNKETENIKKNQSEIKNSITEIKNTLEGIADERQQKNESTTWRTGNRKQSS